MPNECYSSPRTVECPSFGGLADIEEVEVSCRAG